MFRILWLDPGGTTGWGTFQAERIQVGENQYEYFDAKWDCGQIGPGDHHNKLDMFLGLMQTQEFVLGTESFEYRNNLPKAELISCEYIGVAKRFCQERNLELLTQTASQGKVRNKPTAFVKPDNLKRLGLWSPGRPHAMDGYGHLLWHIINRRTDMPKLKADLLVKGWKS